MSNEHNTAPLAEARKYEGLINRMRDRGYETYDACTDAHLAADAIAALQDERDKAHKRTDEVQASWFTLLSLARVQAQELIAAQRHIAKLEGALRNAGNMLHAEGVDTGFIDALLAKGEMK